MTERERERERLGGGAKMHHLLLSHVLLTEKFALEQVLALLVVIL